MIIPKRIFLDLSGDRFKIIEPTLYDLFQIEYLSEQEENREENIKDIFQILHIPDKYIMFSGIIISEVLKGFREQDKEKGGRDYFLGILGFLAHHNHLDLKTFCQKYYLSSLGELLNVREYYYNIMNDKASENGKFFDRTRESEDEVREMEEFIRRMGGG